MNEMKNEVWMFGHNINRSELCAAGTDVSTFLGTNILEKNNSAEGEREENKVKL